MGLADKLAGKTRGIGDSIAARPEDEAASASAVMPARQPRTGPGQLLQTRGVMQQLEAYAGSEPAKAIDAASVGVSKFANRHDDEYSSKEFQALCAEIEKAGRNVQPIRVREVSGREPVRYEVIYGHRRLKACQVLKIPVWAIITKCSDEELFLVMDMENRQRKDPSPFELGDSYRRALDAGLFSSIRQLAQKVHVDHSLAAKAYAIASLPQEVLQAFPSPTQIQYRWGRLLSDALQKDPEAVIRRAKGLSAEVRASASSVLAALIDAPRAPAKVVLRTRGSSGNELGSIERRPNGSWAIQIKSGVLEPERLSELEEMLSRFLASPLPSKSR
jgi:ParB family chromosome partitioning protein